MPELSGDALRKALFDAVAANDGATFAALCDDNEAEVLTGFPAWRTVPEAFRVPDRIGWYSQGLITTASYFAERKQRPELREMLIGNADNNPVVQWERALRSVDPLVEALDYERAAEILREALAAGEQLQGNAVERYLPITCGRLGECLFQLGNADAAAHLTARALSLSAGDRDGQRAYLINLAEIERYRGNQAAASGHYAQLAALLEAAGPNTTEVAHYRRRAALTRAGEPACRVVAEVDRWRFELDEVVQKPPANGVRFLFERNRIPLRRSMAAVQAGAEAGARGDAEAALRQFQAAMAIDPYDPWPHYHAGMALLELGRYAEAIDAYAATEARAPGWFHCRADRWNAEQLAAGAIDRETFIAVRRVDNAGLPPEQVLAIAEPARARHALPALDLAIGNALRQLDRAPEAEAAYRRGVEAATEPDVRSRLLVALAGMVSGDERNQRLREALTLDGNLVAAATARLILAMPSPTAN